MISGIKISRIKIPHLKISHLKISYLKLTLGFLEVLFFIQIFAISAFAEEATFYNKEYLKLDADISSTIDIINTGGTSYIQYIIADLFFHPVSDSRLEIISINSTPESEQEGQRLRFTWLSPKETRVNFIVSSVLKSKTVETPIISTIPYPIAYYPPDLAPYLTETPTADFNDPSIQSIAKNLSEGEHDLFMLTAKVASWVRESVSYNLSTVTAKATKPASWVLEKRQGVCDELTNLFIAIMRAQGIPARFISGLAYTDSPLFPDKWGGHGWAEAYFPGYGWVPFDTTYGQYGWLDASHIKLKEGADATEASTNYEWRGQNVNLGIHPLSMTADILETGPAIDIPFKIEIEANKQKVGLGSYNVITATATNKDNRYHAIDISLGSTDGLLIEGPSRHDLALKPFEKKRISWIVQVKDALKPEFLYTFPLVAYTLRGINATTSFNASIHDPAMGKEDAMVIAGSAEAEGREPIELVCASDDITHHQDQPFSITCSIPLKDKPLGKPLHGLLCADGTCVPAQAPRTVLTITKHTPGPQESLITLLLDDDRAYTSISYTILDEPRIIIYNATAPLYVGYDDSFNLSIMIHQESLAKPGNPQLSASIPGLSKTWPVPSTPESVFNIQMKGADVAGIGGVNITLTYEGAGGKRISDNKTVTIYISEISAWQSIRMAFTQFSLWVHELAVK